MSSDLTFLTNESGKTLRDRFSVILKTDARFFELTFQSARSTFGIVERGTDVPTGNGEALQHPHTGVQYDRYERGQSSQMGRR